MHNPVPQLTFLGSNAAAVQQARAQFQERQLHTIAESAGIALARLPSAKSSPDKVLLAALLKKFAPVSNRWLANALSCVMPRA